MANESCITTREMLAAVKEVGAMPFVLFEYYLTCEDGEGIKPSLKQICDDLGLKKNAVCNLRSRLVEAGWIKFQNDEITILKSFTKNECHSQKMNESFTKNEQRSQKMNDLPQNGIGTEFAKIGFTKEIKSENARALSPISENGFLKTYNEYFPKYRLNIYQQEIIENRIRDGTAWRKALVYWSTNDYRPQSIGKICDKYDEILAETKTVDVATSADEVIKKRDEFRKTQKLESPVL